MGGPAHAAPLTTLCIHPPPPPHTHRTPPPPPRALIFPLRSARFPVDSAEMRRQLPYAVRSNRPIVLCVEAHNSLGACSAHAYPSAPRRAGVRLLSLARFISLGASVPQPAHSVRTALRTLALPCALWRRDRGCAERRHTLSVGATSRSMSKTAAAALQDTTADPAFLGACRLPCPALSTLQRGSVPAPRVLAVRMQQESVTESFL